ncbi:hypothetical protein [Duffyella gerundensis]|uniref:hypothetical protein n=1 Tax=Duffyella gerundensis TaxID=1619313 RepID=UPI001653FA77|nr:hypothetical protein [Duffyella gerundensis]
MNERKPHLRKIIYLLKVLPKKGINAARYLKQTGDYRGLIAIFKRKVFNFIGPEPIWQCRAFIATIKSKFHKNDTKLHFLTFYTEGFPADDGMDLKYEVKELLRKTMPFVDSVKAVSASQLKKNPETAIYVKEFEEEAIWNFKTNKIGFLRWKPYILLKELEAMSDGDILFYRDCNITKYPNILADIHNIRKNTLSTLDYIGEDIFTPVELFPNLKVKHNVKIDILKRCNILSEENIESYLHNASIIICRKTPNVIKFLNDWLQLCMDDMLLSPNVQMIQHCDFLHNTQEQAIMNGLLLKNKITNPSKLNKPLGLSIVNRLFSIEKLVKVPRVAVLYCGQLRNFDNSELLLINNNNILSKLNCDVFASVWDERGYSFHHGQASPAHYASNKDVSSEKIEYCLAHSGCNVRNVEIENFDEWISNQDSKIQSLYHEGLKFDSKVVKATAFPQLYKIFRANQLKSEFEKKNGFKYDLVIRMRPDMGFIESIPDYILHEELTFTNQSSNIYHLNPPKIFYPNRIYDILFWGNSDNMDKLCNSWPNIENLLAHDFDNGLPVVDCCRLLFVQALESRLNVVDVPRCIGDIYRDENIEDYKNKILYEFN